MSNVIKLDSVRRAKIDPKSIGAGCLAIPRLPRVGIPQRLKYAANQSAYEKAYVDGFNCCVTKMENEQLLNQLGILT